MTLNLKMLVALIAMTLLQTAKTKVDPFVKTNTIPTAGMAIRLEESTFNHLRHGMQEFLPTYIEHDLDLPTEYNYTFGVQSGIFTDLLTWKFEWTNITYSNNTNAKASFDFNKVKLFMSNIAGKSLIKVDFPAVEQYSISAH